MLSCNPSYTRFALNKSYIRLLPKHFPVLYSYLNASFELNTIGFSNLITVCSIYFNATYACLKALNAVPKGARSRLH